MGRTKNRTRTALPTKNKTKENEAKAQPVGLVEERREGAEGEEPDACFACVQQRRVLRLFEGQRARACGERLYCQRNVMAAAKAKTSSAKNSLLLLAPPATPSK